MKLQSFYESSVKELENISDEFSFTKINDELQSKLNEKYKEKDVVIYETDFNHHLSMFFAPIEKIIINLSPEKGLRGKIEINKTKCREISPCVVGKLKTCEGPKEVVWASVSANTELTKDQYYKMLENIDIARGKDPQEKYTLLAITYQEKGELSSHDLKTLKTLPIIEDWNAVLFDGIIPIKPEALDDSTFFKRAYLIEETSSIQTQEISKKTATA